MSFVNELKRRNVFRVGIAYAVASWVLMQLADMVLENIEAPPWIFQVMMLVVALGFIASLIIAWAYELTPQGIKRDREVARGESVTYETGLKLDRIIMGFLLVAVTFFALDKYVFTSPENADQGQKAERQPALATEIAEQGEPATDSQSIAVLPFTNMSSDPEQEYFSDGVTEEIISKLSRIENLAVASRTSVMRFKKTELDIREIAEALGVRYILEGSVRKSDKQVRIIAQLIDSNNGFHVWGRDFDGNIDQIFDVQENTARQIADALDIRLSPLELVAVEKRYTSNSEAYDAYLRGHASFLLWSDINEVLSAQAQFEKALELEPDYPPALAGLASVEAQLYRNFDADDGRLLRGTALASRALVLDPSLIRGHVALGELAAIQYDYRGAAEKFREVVAMDPDNALAWDFLSWVLAYQQPPDATGSENAARKALQFNPDYINAYYHLGRALFLQKRFDEAISAFSRIFEHGEDSDLANLGLAQTYLEMGNLDLARKHLELSMLVDESPIEISISCFIDAADGDKEAALECLERLFELNYRDFTYLEITPHLEDLRADTRYQDLVVRFRKQDPKTDIQ